MQTRCIYLPAGSERENLALKRRNFAKMIWIGQAQLHLRIAIREMAAGANPAASIASAAGERDDFGLSNGWYKITASRQ